MKKDHSICEKKIMSLQSDLKRMIKEKIAKRKPLLCRIMISNKCRRNDNVAFFLKNSP
jgi:hypothetical protein